MCPLLLLLFISFHLVHLEECSVCLKSVVLILAFSGIFCCLDSSYMPACFGFIWDRVNSLLVTAMVMCFGFRMGVMITLITLIG